MFSYSKFSYEIFGDFIKSFNFYFYDLKEDIIKANMNFTLDEYLSMSMLTCLISFILGNVFFMILFNIFTTFLTSFFLSITISIGITASLFFILYIYPSSVVKIRENKIEKSLPFAVSYLTTISSGGGSPINMFKILSEFKEYGEVSKESRNIVRNVNVFGGTFLSAITKQSKITPSKNFRELLWGISSVVSSGGDLTNFLRQKSESLMNIYEGKIKKYSQNLSLIVEIYLTLIITSSIFFITLSSVINSITGGVGIAALQSFVVFILLPFVSIGFMAFIRILSPVNE